MYAVAHHTTIIIIHKTFPVSFIYMHRVNSIFGSILFAVVAETKVINMEKA